MKCKTSVISNPEAFWFGLTVIIWMLRKGRSVIRSLHLAFFHASQLLTEQEYFLFRRDDDPRGRYRT